MKKLNTIITVMGLALGVSPAFAGEKTSKPESKAGAYPLKTCVVSGEKLEGDMGDPYVFKQDGREVKLCCKSCLKDFKRDPASFLKKLDAAGKK
jgi:hypothetical protein